MKSTASFEDENYSVPNMFEGQTSGLRGKSLSRLHFHAIADEVISLISDEDIYPKNPLFCRDLVKLLNDS